MFAVINGALIQIIMVSRILYGLSKKGWLHHSLGIVHPVTRTPLRTTMIAAIGIMVLALSAEIADLAENTSFVILIVFILVNMALIRIKAKDPFPLGVKVFPVWVPWVGLVFSLVFVLFKVYNDLT
jgi:amino acid transporter